MHSKVQSTCVNINWASMAISINIIARINYMVHRQTNTDHTCLSVPLKSVPNHSLLYSFRIQYILYTVCTVCICHISKDDVIGSLEKVAKKIRNAHLESRANSTTVSTITNFFLPQKK
jgi:hypothetical protein